MQIYISRNNGHAKATLCLYNETILHPNITSKNLNISNHHFIDKPETRSQIMENKIGVPLQINFKCIDANNYPISNVEIIISHCDKDGIVANSFLQGTLNKTWLTGTQYSNQNGICHFKTIVPGWQNGHLTHLKVMLIIPNKKSIETLLYFPATMLGKVYTTPLYSKGKNPITLNGDVILKGNKLEYKKQILQISGNIEKGYKASYHFEVK